MSFEKLEQFDAAYWSEIGGEKAGSLGRAGRKIEATLQELKDFKGSAALRDDYVKAAAQAVYEYFVQRELCGLRNHDEAIQLYEIPREVLARVGAC